MQSVSTDPYVGVFVECDDANTGPVRTQVGYPIDKLPDEGLDMLVKWLHGIRSINDHHHVTCTVGLHCTQECLVNGVICKH